MKNFIFASLLVSLVFSGSNGFAQSQPGLLFSAAKRGDTEAIRQVLDSGFDINSADKEGRTALMVAAGNGKLEAVKTLLKAGAAINAKSSKGQTALMNAVVSGNMVLVKLLLDNGADVSVATPQGETALDVAKRSGKKQMISLLSNNGVDAKTEQAAQAFKAGNFAKAITLFKAVVAVNSQDAFAWHFLGRSLEKTGDLEGAQKAYQKSLENAPTGKLAQRNQAFLGKLQNQGGKVFTDCPDCPEMVIIPAGSFDMGSDKVYDDELPVHRVTFGQPFAIGKTEVTQGQWKSVMGNNPSSNISCGDSCPVDQVSRFDALEFIQKLSEKTGKQYRLPSEAEWEYACRAGVQQTFCGSDDANAVAWFEENSSHPVAGKQPNAWGLYDMSGNVWEWVEDPPHDNYFGAPADGSVWEGDVTFRGVRGGSWYSAPQYGRAAVRGKYVPRTRFNDGGFRLARTLP